MGTRRLLRKKRRPSRVAATVRPAISPTHIPRGPMPAPPSPSPRPAPRHADAPIGERGQEHRARVLEPAQRREHLDRPGTGTARQQREAASAAADRALQRHQRMPSEHSTAPNTPACQRQRIAGERRDLRGCRVERMADAHRGRSARPAARQAGDVDRDLVPATGIPRRPISSAVTMNRLPSPRHRSGVRGEQAADRRPMRRVETREQAQIGEAAGATQVQRNDRLRPHRGRRDAEPAGSHRGQSATPTSARAERHQNDEPPNPQHRRQRRCRPC